MSPGTKISPASRSVAELQRSLRSSSRAQVVLDWPHELVAAAPHGGGAAATVNVDRSLVLAAHSGAGSSTIALALADAAAAAGKSVHLVEMSEPMRSGLLAASHAELGVLATGDWRRGRRGASITVDRQTILAETGSKPTASDHDAEIVDVGLPKWKHLPDLGSTGQRLVIVGRATVPGVRAIEQTLAALARTDVTVAMIGSERWPGIVRSSCGPHLKTAAHIGAVVSVPFSKRLEACGPDHRELPSSVSKAASAMWKRCVEVTGR